MSNPYRVPAPPPPSAFMPPPTAPFPAAADNQDGEEHTVAVEGVADQPTAEFNPPMPTQFQQDSSQVTGVLEDATGIALHPVTLSSQPTDLTKAAPVTSPAYGTTEKMQVAQRRPRPAHGVTLESLVREAFENDFSDIHLGVGELPRFRDRGRLEISDHPVTDTETFEYWLEEILTPEQIQRFQQEWEYDGATQYEGMARVRINVFVALNGPAMVLRLIPLRIKTIDELSLPMIFRDLCHYHKGLILVTGPTGSGKSTTLAAMVDYINSEMPKHIISIEDPVEFVHQSKKAMIRQREVGIHTMKFDNALKASLREDPDVILIGEMRDRETVNTALKAAQTGHLVFGTLHTNSAVKTIERILNLYNPEEQGPMRVQVAESLVGVIAQSLVRTTDSKRAAIHEIMINTDAVKDYILRGEVESIEQLIPQCTYDGMMTMNQCLYDLYEIGRIDEETALEASPKPNEMAQILRGRI
jgi:twitching motility protein PilT